MKFTMNAIFALFLYLSIGLAHADSVEVLLNPVPTIVTGILNPFLITLDGRVIDSKNKPAVSLQINGSVVEPRPGKERPFFYQSRSDFLDVSANVPGTKGFSSQIVLPRVKIKSIKDKDSGNLVTVEFDATDVIKFAIDGRDIPLNNGVAKWSTVVSKETGIVTAGISVFTNSGVRRLYDLNFIPSAVYQVSDSTIEYSMTDEWPAILIRPTSAHQISTLTFRSTSLVIRRNSKNPTRGIVNLAGLLNKPETRLYFGDKLINLRNKGNFSVNFPIENKMTEISLYSIHPKDGVEKEVVKVFFPTWEFFQKFSTGKPLKRFNLIPMIGVSSLTYTEEAHGVSAARLNQISSVAKLYGQYFIVPPNLDIEATFLYHFYSLSQSFDNIPVSALKATYMEGDVNMGYGFPFVKEPWGFSIRAGVSYYSLTENAGRTEDPGNFGFSTFYLPEIYPSFRKRVGQSDVMTLNLKIVPASSQSAAVEFLKFSQRLLAARFNYRHMYANGNSFQVSLDVSDLRVIEKKRDSEQTDATCASGPNRECPNSFTVYSNLISLSVGYGF